MTGCSELCETVWLIASMDASDIVCEAGEWNLTGAIHPPSLHERGQPIWVYPPGQDEGVFLHPLMQATKHSSLRVYKDPPVRTALMRATRHTPSSFISKLIF